VALVLGTTPVPESVGGVRRRMPPLAVRPQWTAKRGPDAQIDRQAILPLKVLGAGAAEDHSRCDLGNILK
jgi:hypothetical protein